MPTPPRTAPDRDVRYREFVSHCADGVWCAEFEAGIPTGLEPDAQVGRMLADGRVTEANQAAAALHGSASGEALRGRSLGDMLGATQADLAQFLRVFVTRGYHAVQRGRAVCLTGVVHDGCLVRVWGVDHRSSVRRHVDGRLRQTQKLAAVGQVATGVAHDFNNLLTAIMGYTEIVRDTLGPEHACIRDVEQVLSAGRRAEALARQLLSFSRTQRRRTDFVDVNQVVTGFVPLLKRLVGDEIQIELSSAPVPAVVRADRGQLELVIMNLAVNARDAMNGSGRIAIGIEIDGPGAETPAGTVSLIVTDTGAGVPADVTAHIFEPFFTTKSNGTGLGLATVHDIVVESGGTVEVGRDAGGGARFRVRLPAAPADADTLELPVGDALRAGIGR